MRKTAALLPILLLAAACEPKAATEEPSTPPAEQPGQPLPGPIDAPPQEPAQQPSAPLNPPAPGQPGGLPDDRMPLPERPIREGTAQDAANVVQTYYALLEEGRYSQAWALWGDGGRASGQSPRAFADSFSRYSEYHANIGAPGRIDAGAGQRYVEVPVQVYGRLKAGQRPFNQRGAVTLHRTADIDGTTAEQKSWRISKTTVNPPAAAPTPDPMPVPGPGPRPDPRPNPPPAKTPDLVTASYRCEGDLRLTIDFDNRAGTATVRGGGRRNRAVLKIQPVASGIHYAGGGYDLRGKGNEATWTAPGARPVICRSGR